MKFSLRFFLSLSFVGALIIVSPALALEIRGTPGGGVQVDGKQVVPEGGGQIIEGGGIVPLPPPEEPPQCNPEPPICRSSSSEPYECNVSTVYRCGNNLCGANGGFIQKATESFTCKTTTDSCDDGCKTTSFSSTSIIGGPFYTNAQEYSKAGKYQVCPAGLGNVWRQIPPAYECAGQCYPAPRVKPLNDSTLSPKNALESGKAKLPVNFGWKNNVETEVATDACIVDNYQYEISGGPASSAGGPAFEPVTPPIRNVVVSPGECTLTPGIPSYVFSLRACANGTCGTQGTLPFATSSAPQLLSPYDPDWQGNKKAEGISPPFRLQWCPAKDANSYTFRVSIVGQDGKVQCHPEFAIGGAECGFRTVQKLKRPPPFPSEQELKPEFADTLGIFTKATTYVWEVAGCLFEGGADCGSFSQQWSFQTSNFDFEPPQIILQSPQDDPTEQTPVGLPLALSWAAKPGLNLFEYEIFPSAGATPISGITSFVQTAPFHSPMLKLNSSYQWRIRGCSGFTKEQCDTEKRWEEWTQKQAFKVTGLAPKNLREEPAEEGKIVIPATLRWDAVPGAHSYDYEVAEDELFTRKVDFDKAKIGSLEVAVDYPKLLMGKDYLWRVRTCTDENGKECGPWNEPAEKFHTFTLKNPAAPEAPQNGKQFSTTERTLSWSSVSGAKAYLSTIHYETSNPPQEETDPRCPPLVNTDIYSNEKTSVPQISPKLTCLGNYTWQVVSCLDAECAEKSTITPLPWTFTYVQPEPSALAGLLPCGRASNSPDTPYNERDPCGFKEIFLLIRNLVDFALWKLSLIIVVLMAITTGAIMFFSFGGTDVLIKVKSIWKSIGIGVLILLFSWLFLNILLNFLGFNVAFYGKWHEPPL